jgi:hypothetical protein
VANFYRTAFTNQPQLTIAGTTHALGTPDLLYQLYTPQGDAFEAGTLHVDPVTATVTLTFGDPMSGSLLLWPVRAVTPTAPVPVPPSAPPVSGGPGGMPDALCRMLVETVVQTNYSGQDAYGKPVYGAPWSRPARIEGKITTLSSSAGLQRTSTTRVFLNGDVPITVRDTLTLPDGTQPAIQYVARHLYAFVPALLHHYTVFL